MGRKCFVFFVIQRVHFAKRKAEREMERLFLKFNFHTVVLQASHNREGILKTFVLEKQLGRKKMSDIYAHT